MCCFLHPGGTGKQRKLHANPRGRNDAFNARRDGEKLQGGEFFSVMDASSAR